MLLRATKETLDEDMNNSFSICLRYTIIKSIERYVDSYPCCILEMVTKAFCTYNHKLKMDETIYMAPRAI